MLWISLINEFSDISFSHGSVATRLRCGGICNNHFIANFLQIVIVKEFQKIGQYLTKLCLKYSRLFFPDTVYFFLH